MRAVELLLAGCLLVSPLAAQVPVLVGVVTAVSDGDTLKIGPVRLRLHGIDAPETRQTCQRPEIPGDITAGVTTGSIEYRCGIDATNALKALVAGKRVSCQILDSDRYGRLVGRCRVGAMDINRAMVRLGWAVAYTGYSKDYVTEEERAIRARVGIWRGSFQLPEQWRKATSKSNQVP